MRISLVTLVGLGMFLVSSAEAAPSFPVGATGLESQLLSTENADARAWIKDEAQRELGNGNGDAVLKLIGTNQAKCSSLAALNSKAADLLFKDGLEAYKKNQMEAALQKFRAALNAEPNHELAKEYLDLTQSKLEVAADRALIAWRKDFNEAPCAWAMILTITASGANDPPAMPLRP